MKRRAVNEKRKDIKWHGVRDKQGWNVQICIRGGKTLHSLGRGKPCRFAVIAFSFFGYSGYEGAVT